MAGDYNIQEVLLSYGGLQQICGVPTRKGATLQLILTDLHTYMHPPYALPPLQVDEGKAGKDSDHQALILASKASKEFFVKREKRKVITRPIPESKIGPFCAELTRCRLEGINNTEDIDVKTDTFHNYLRQLLNKHFPEKKVTVSNLDKFWMNPQPKNFYVGSKEQDL